MKRLLILMTAILFEFCASASTPQKTHYMELSEYKKIRSEFYPAVKKGYYRNDHLTIAGTLSITEFLAHVKANFPDKFELTMLEGKKVWIKLNEKRGLTLIDGLAEKNKIKIVSNWLRLTQDYSVNPDNYKESRLANYAKSEKALENITKTSKEPSEKAKAELELHNMRMDRDHFLEMYQHQSAYEEEKHMVEITYQSVEGI